jgi:hypothetical protein
MNPFLGPTIAFIWPMVNSVRGQVDGMPDLNDAAHLGPNARVVFPIRFQFDDSFNLVGFGPDPTLPRRNEHE